MCIRDSLYQLDPYALEWKNDHYYLIGFSHKHQRMAHFRVDRLSGIKILPSGFTPDEDFDVAGYTNKIVDMFAADRTVSVELLCENKQMCIRDSNLIDQLAGGNRYWSEETGRQDRKSVV